MRRRVALTLLALPVSGLFVACTSDLDAPDAYTEPSISAGGGPGGLDVDCEAFPIGAVGADYSFTPQLTAMDDGMRTWMASNLPEGLEIDANSGEISGVPTTPGTVMTEISIMDGSGMQATTCDITINPRLGVDLDPVIDDLPFCLRQGDQTVLDLLLDGTGNGEPITCRHGGGSGDGALPAGISVNAETCELEGSLTDDRFGTWTFIVHGEQSGAAVHVPYCVTNEDPTGYQVTMDHSGLADEGVDATLVPIFRRFNPDAAIAVGMTDDPRIEVTDSDSCGPGGCFYGYAFSFGASPFSSELSIPNMVIDDENGSPAGFFHGLGLDGPMVSEDFRDRAWAVTFELDYCIADNEADPAIDDDGPCEGGTNVRQNGAGEFVTSILMVPQ